MWNAKRTLICKRLCRNMQRSRKKKKLEEFIVTIYKLREMRVSRLVVKLKRNQVTPDIHDLAF